MVHHDLDSIGLAVAAKPKLQRRRKVDSFVALGQDDSLHRVTGKIKSIFIPLGAA